MGERREEQREREREGGRMGKDRSERGKCSTCCKVGIYHVVFIFFIFSLFLAIAAELKGSAQYRCTFLYSSTFCQTQY
jgi:hypothetical protein